MAFWNLQWRSPSNSISHRSPPRAWRNVKLQGLKERRGERDREREREGERASCVGIEKERMREIDRVKSAGNKHLWVFYAQAVGSRGVGGVFHRSRGSKGREKHIIPCVCACLCVHTGYQINATEVT